MWMVITLTAGLVMQSAAAPVQIGVAARAPDGQICVALPEPARTPGTALTLIELESGQSLLYASIVRPAPECEPLERALIPGPYYLVKPRTATDSFAPWVALVGRLGTRRVAAGRIAAHVSAVHPAVQFRSCTSR